VWFVGSAVYGPEKFMMPGEDNAVTLKGPRGEARGSVTSHRVRVS